MSSPWLSHDDRKPTETAQAIADAYRDSHDPAIIAQKALEKRAAFEAAKLAALQAAMDAGVKDPRTTAEQLAGMVEHDPRYDDRRARQSLPQPSGPRDKTGMESDAPKSLMDRAVSELGLSASQAERVVMAILSEGKGKQQ